MARRLKNLIRLSKCFQISHQDLQSPRVFYKIEYIITWIISNIKLGQLQAIDQAFRLIQTEYYFFSEGDFQPHRFGFIQYSLQGLLYDPKINGFYFSKRAKSSQYIQIGPLKIIPHLNSPFYSAFTFWPSTKRMKQYRMLEGGYSGVTSNLSFGKGAGSCQSLISQIYSVQGYHLGISQVSFIHHNGDLGQKKQQSPKFWASNQIKTQKWKKIQNQFYNWQIIPITLQYEIKKLSYLLNKQQPKAENIFDSLTNNIVEQSNARIQSIKSFSKKSLNKDKLLKQKQTNTNQQQNLDQQIKNQKNIDRILFINLQIAVIIVIGFLLYELLKKKIKKLTQFNKLQGSPQESHKIIQNE